MKYYRKLIILLCLLVVACADDAPQDKEKQAIPQKPLPNNTYNKTDHKQLYKLIANGKAYPNEVLEALKTDNTLEMTNLIHALYSMRWHKRINSLLYALWDLDKEKHPNINWSLIEKKPIRIALASTINRIKTDGTEKYIDFIRQNKYDKHDFTRAQVVVALGLNGEVKDVAYLEEMADKDEVYLSQSAITSLVLMQNKIAKDTLIKLANKHKNTPKGELIIKLLGISYNLYPSKKPQ